MRRGVHPACIGLGRPFPFVGGNWTQELNGEGGSTYPHVFGLRLQFPGGLYGSAVIQRIHAVRPEPGKIITVAARIRLDHKANVRFWFGLWNAQLDPLFIPPTDGLFLQQYDDVEGYPVKGHAVASSSGATTEKLFDAPHHVYHDLAIVILETSRADFIWQRYDPADPNVTQTTLPSWASFTVTEHIPTVPLRPSVLAFHPQTAAGSGLNVRGLVVRETTLRE
jgi:hypothetical protein